MKAQNLDIYGHAPIPWSRALKQLETQEQARTRWLATSDPDGRPHVAAVGAVWSDGKFYFVSDLGRRGCNEGTARSNTLEVRHLVAIRMVDPRV